MAKLNFEIEYRTGENPLGDGYYVAMDGQSVGPFETAEMARGAIDDILTETLLTSVSEALFGEAA